MGRIDKKTKHRRPVCETAAPSRGQRKRALKKASLVRKKGLVELAQRGSGSHQPAEGPPKADNSPSLFRDNAAGARRALSIRHVLERGADPPVPGRVSSANQGATAVNPIRNKDKRALLAAELEQVNAVLETPSFQQDPFAAVQAHLRLTTCSSSSINSRPSTGGYPPNPTQDRKAKSNEHPARKAGSRTRADERQRAKPYKGRNAKMKVKR